MSRTSLLTPEILIQLDDLAGYGVSDAGIAASLGISRATFYEWLKRGARERRRLAQPRAKAKDAEAIYVAFLDTYKKALARLEKNDLVTIGVASKGYWQAAAWRLERRFPETWSSVSRELRELQKQVAELAKVIGGSAGVPAEAGQATGSRGQSGHDVRGVPGGPNGLLPAGAAPESHPGPGADRVPPDHPAVQGPGPGRP